MRTAFALLVLTFLPGIPLAATLFRRLRDGLSWISMAGVLGLLWSTALTFGLTLVHTRLSLPNLVIFNLVPTFMFLLKRGVGHTARETIRQLSFPPSHALLVILALGVLLLPFVAIQRSLPTGDVQMAIFWGGKIVESAQLPDYTEALRFNRDPADFATPALHALTAAMIQLSGDPLRGPAWLAAVSGILLAGMAAAFASLLAPRRASVLPVLAFLLASSNARALRYTAAPGYHYQNVFGEMFLLLGFFALLSSVGGRGNQRTLLITAATVGLLPLVHQFSTFFAALLLPSMLFVLLVRYRGEVTMLFRRAFGARRHAAGAALVLVGGMGITFLLQSPVATRALSRLVTPTPHLRTTLIPLSSVPELLGTPFTLLGIAGAIVAVVHLRRQSLEWRWSLFLLWGALLILLSQGPRWFLDIPSARTLFYAITPIAVTAALAAATAGEQIRALWPRSAPFLLPIGFALLLGPVAGAQLNASLQGLDFVTPGTATFTNHAHHRNSTLTPATRELLSTLAEHPSCGTSIPCEDSVLVDAWGRRRLTWALLSPRPVLTRIGGDLAISAREASQSPQRKKQYEALLDFEKIFALGNLSVIQQLLERHGISYIGSATRSSHDVFAHNPFLEPLLSNADVTLYRVKKSGRSNASSEDSDASFLLSPTTLANDVGDTEDVHPHAQISLAATQLSEPFMEQGRTVREIVGGTAVLHLNVGTYLPERWSRDPGGLIATPLQLLLRVVSNGARGQFTLPDGTPLMSFALPSTDRPQEIRFIIPSGRLRTNARGVASVRINLNRGPLRMDLVAAGPPSYGLEDPE